MTDDTTAQKLSIDTKTISIKVIQVNGHKMTKATFDQIPINSAYDSYFRENMEFDSWRDKTKENHEEFLKNYVLRLKIYPPDILGWVKRDRDDFSGYWILFIDNVKISKFFCKKKQFSAFRFDKFDQLYIAT